MTARLSRPVSVRRLHKEETVDLTATEAERTAIAEALDLLSVESLEAEFSVRPWRADGVRVEGIVRGVLTQACVVTLEPVRQEVEEAIDLRLHPDAGDAASVDVDPQAPDPPERLDGDIVDLGAIALEHFALGIDPYPKSPGAELEVPAQEEEHEQEPSPFAALAALKTSPN